MKRLQVRIELSDHRDFGALLAKAGITAQDMLSACVDRALGKEPRVLNSPDGYFSKLDDLRRSAL